MCPCPCDCELTVKLKKMYINCCRWATPVKKKAKKIGVVGISKAENVQLGLILRWVALELDWDTIPNEVLVNPEALTKLIGRYKAE